ncbi:MAG: thiamine pyrophosphate-dependent enzyme [Thermoanaerobaculia bacterium]|nr:thiamine pyrophosphate-dependent enzyme [Thermoanaerobaculia bacterium]
MSAIALSEAARTQVLLGCEAVALGAAHSGISSAYGYPGTPSTEILETLIRISSLEGRPRAKWCVNEKAAYETALGVSMAGRRVLVAMKHVGLNVAADPFINSAIVAPLGGLVLAVADDPGMHSSQNEQDSRFYAEFAGVPCFEPATPQEAYEMTREAFEISEGLQVPVMVRLVTRLAHQRSAVETGDPAPENRLTISRDRRHWVLLPAFSRENWRELLDQQENHQEWSNDSPFSPLEINHFFRELGVITTGIARTYYREVVDEIGTEPSHLHIGTYPIPIEKIRELASHVDSILLLEDGYPFVERQLRGLLGSPVSIMGRMSGELPRDGELSQDTVRRALGLQPKPTLESRISIPGRPPRLCDGCPHADVYKALAGALRDHDDSVVMSDIGCYTLGTLPPFGIGDSCVCMGASVGMAKGAADAGAEPVVAVIGDSTFLHSGLVSLIDAIVDDSNMTLVILDNEVVAMTGAQPTMLPSRRLVDAVLGLGADPNHVHTAESHPRKIGELEDALRSAIAYRGLSVVITHRECIEGARKRKADERRKGV